MYYDFTPREKKIIYYLSINDTYISGKQLAIVTQTTERTVRSDIKNIMQTIKTLELNEHFELVSAHIKGYKFNVYNEEEFKAFVKDLDYDVNSLERELINFLEREIRMLVVLNENISLYDLSHIVFYSEQKIRSVIKNYNESKNRKYLIKLDKGCASVVGKELNIRLGILSTIFVNPYYKNITHDVVKMITNQQFEDNVMSTIEEVIINNESLNLPYISFLYISKALFVSYRRNQFKKYLSLTEEDYQIIDKYDIEFKVALEIIKTLEVKYQYDFYKNDIYFLAIIIIAFSNRKSKVIQEMDNDSYEMCKYLTEVISNDFNINDNNAKDNLMESLSSYFWAFKVRIRFEINRQYLGVTRVKRKQLVAGEYSRYLSRLIEDRYQIILPDKEAVFLMICISEALKKGDKITPKILVTSTYGYTEANRFAQNVMAEFKDIKNIDIKEIYEVDKYYDDYDLILSNQKKVLEYKDSKYAFYKSYSDVNTLSVNTYQRILNRYDSYWLIKNINDNNFITKLDLINKNESFCYIAINYLNDFHDDIQEIIKKLEVEEIRLTHECGYRMAFISNIDNHYKDNEIYFLVLNAPISWYLRFVQCIILVKAKTYLDLQKYESGLQVILHDSDKCSHLISCPDMQTLVKLLDMEGKV